MGALNEASENLIIEMDASVIANKMLDAFNRYRETGTESEMDNARKFAMVLKIDSRAFPALFETVVRPAVTADADA